MPVLRDLGYLLGPARTYRPAYRRIADWLALESGAMLDIGCGPGWLCIEAARGHPELDCVGIDRSPRMVARAEANRSGTLNCTFKEMDGEHILYPAGTFHCVVAVQSAHHWKNPDRVINEALRVLRPAGRLVVMEAEPEAPIDEDWLHRPAGLPPSFWIRRQWRRWSCPVESLGALCEARGVRYTVQSLGFYQVLVATP